MRETCLLCVSKHIALAIVLINEAALGYPLHLWLAVGHLAEAEAECVSEFPKLAENIRKTRINYMGQPVESDLSLEELLDVTRGVAESENGYSEAERVRMILRGEPLPENKRS